MDDREYTYLQEKIQRLIGINLGDYKSQQMRRRLEGFIERSRASGVVPFCKMLEREPGALSKLRNFLTINVSEFFRDADQFGLLRARILPDLLQRSPTLNIWSAGCSVGAEAYSIAIMLEELCPERIHRILATDLDANILQKAVAGGPYAPAEVKCVARALLLKHFVSSVEGYWITDKTKRSLEFRQQNLLDGPCEHSFDLIVCRNVMIYFSDEAKKKLHRGFYRSLKENGVLFLGGTEALMNFQELGFERLYNSIYRKSSTDPAPRARMVASLPTA